VDVTVERIKNTTTRGGIRAKNNVPSGDEGPRTEAEAIRLLQKGSARTRYSHKNERRRSIARRRECLLLSTRSSHMVISNHREFLRGRWKRSWLIVHTTRKDWKRRDWNMHLAPAPRVPSHLEVNSRNNVVGKKETRRWNLIIILLFA